MKYIIEADERSELVQVISVMPNGTVYTNERSIDELEELTSDYINKHYGSLQDDAYERGHGIGYQKGFEDGKAVYDKGCEGCEYEGRISPCSSCARKNVNDYWTAKDDKFEFGDEIIDLNGVKGCVVSKDNEEGNTIYALFDGYRTPQCINQRNYRKTGKRYDIEKILEEMKGDNDK